MTSDDAEPSSAASGPLDALHAAAGATFTEAWGRRVAAAFTDDPATEARYAERSVALFDLSWRGTVEVRGEAALDTLDRILSSAVSRLTAQGDGQLAALLSAKGKLLAVTQLFREDDHHFRMRLEEPARDTLLRELQKYAFLSDVDVAASAESVGLALRGPAAPQVAGALLPGAEELTRPWSRLRGSTAAGEGVEVVRVGPEKTDTRAGGFDVWVDAASASAVWERLAAATRAAGGGPAGWLALESLRIDAGFTRHGIDYHDDAFPAEAGKEHVLSYDKCYVGQEVVARMRTYGSANRRFVRVEVTGGAEPEPGWVMRSGDALAGRITSVARLDPEEPVRALARVKRRFLEAEELEVDREDAAEAAAGAADGTPMRCRLLPLHGEEDSEG